MTALPRKLTQLARLYGIQTSYRDMRKQKQDASVDSLLAVLQILGADVAGVDDAERALVAHQRESWERVVEPVIVAWDGNIPPIPIRSSEAGNVTFRYAIETEDADERQSITGRTALAKLPLKAQREIGGSRYVERELRIKGSVPVGYHRIRFEFGKNPVETMLISAPLKAYFPFDRRVWGVFAPIYSLTYGANPKAGDLTGFAELLNWAGGMGSQVAGTLPLLAAFLDEPFEPSPYAPASRLFWNEFYVDLRARVRRSTSQPLKPLVDYRSEMRALRRILEKDAEAFFNNERSEERTRFETFVREQEDLEEYARFRGVTEKQRAGWTSWPSRLRDGKIQAGDYDAKVARYHAYAQFRIQEQLRNLARQTRDKDQLLYLDLPLGLHPDSYDIWRFREFFVREAAGGAPPDPVFTKGQNWGFPPMHPRLMREHHHAYTIKYIRNHLQYARMLRIDHVMGLHRLFWIPNGFTGDKGVYVEYPAEELYAILSVESHRNQAGIVGENLGTVPPEVHKSMRRHNIHQMYVLQYEIVGSDPKRALRSVPENAVASLNTHDMPPFRAFLEGADIDDRLDLAFLDAKAEKEERRQRAAIRKMLVEFLQHRKLLLRTRNVKAEEIFQAASRFLATSMASVVLVNLEDLWGETSPQNVPATHKERPNWRRRMKLTLEEMKQSRTVRETLVQIDEDRQA